MAKILLVKDLRLYIHYFLFIYVLQTAAIRLFMGRKFPTGGT